jgi:hypothetical protein
MSFIPLVEDSIFSKYTDSDKFKVTVIFFKNKAWVWFDILKKNQENWGLGPYATSSTFKKLLFHQLLPGNYEENMGQKLYDLKQESLSVT